MTVTYSKNIPNTNFCGFTKLLFRWRGSVFKLVLPELAVYMFVYFMFSALYRFALPEDCKRIFEKIVLICESFSSSVPLSFVLGIYVTIVVTRWWDQYMLIPWPDDVCILAATYINRQDERSKTLKKAFVRYINLAFVLSFSVISPRIASLYPTLDHLVNAGYMTPSEKAILEALDEESSHNKMWLPLAWACLLIAQARREGRLIDDHGQKAIAIEITNLRCHCSRLQEYHTMSVPLVYTQVATMATYTFFISSIMGQQFLDPGQGYPSHSVDGYIPMFSILQYLFYMGWLRVAESLLNPFGEDDDDFDIIEFLDRHFEVSCLIVDEMLTVQPDAVQDLAPGKAPVDKRAPLPEVEFHYTRENPQVVITNEVKLVTASFTETSVPLSLLPPEEIGLRPQYRQRVSSARRSPSPVGPNVW
ncbi:bestrophin-2-like [Penaeus chinensis]|uniref:bestrophin-2-like n=1 Tax=Penaeus chinensis TaxID=139456 RepID=UPI001FB75502|nr:bestrophin-2-like [Penaeus chinensis]